MKHTLKIGVSKESKNAGIAAVRRVSVREKFLGFILENKTKPTVIVHGDSVEELAIKEVPEGGVTQ